jgi:hypothetical protein
MKNLSYLFVFICLFSCTSNTIFEKPKDLIPKDTMSLLVQELVIASSSKFMKNKNYEKKINYMPLVYDLFNIDSTRFQTSNLYYMSTIDDYQSILEDAKTNLEKKKSFFDKIKKEKDSLRQDSLKNIKTLNKLKRNRDSLQKKELNFKDTLLLDSKKNSKL